MPGVAVVDDVEIPVGLHRSHDPVTQEGNRLDDPAPPVKSFDDPPVDRAGRLAPGTQRGRREVQDQMRLSRHQASRAPA
jgi:hypothetical protein